MSIKYNPLCVSFPCRDAIYSIAGKGIKTSQSFQPGVIIDRQTFGDKRLIYIPAKVAVKHEPVRDAL